MDQLDRDLLHILQKDAKIPFTRIAEELKQPDTTIHFRAKRLKESNTITRYCALVQPEALGYTASAIFRIEIGGHILPEISKERTHSFAEEIAENEQFLWVAVDEEPMIIHALTMGVDEEDLQKRAETLRKSPDIVKVTMTPVSAVVKGWELSGNPK
ncbi:MAG: putative HTH-type transcriptional regulator [Candidatus Thorarchaeota archaeon AB_25]|nr:MAG: putative HTH-type transcriptional regulator [Candidatus Thorarchaeota archaeon AB_25]